jgi:hypothetical protein
LVQGWVGSFNHQSPCPYPFPQCNPLSISKFGLNGLLGRCFIQPRRSPPSLLASLRQVVA